MSSIPVWPSSLPSLLIAGYGESSPMLAIATDMDAGPAKIRRRFTAGVRPLQVSIFLDTTKNQRFIFEDFFYNGLLGGTLAFQMTHRIGGVQRTDIVRFAKGKPPAYRAVSSTLYQASLELEIMP